MQIKHHLITIGTGTSLLLHSFQEKFYTDSVRCNTAIVRHDIPVFALSLSGSMAKGRGSFCALVDILSIFPSVILFFSFPLPQTGLCSVVEVDRNINILRGVLELTIL